MDAAVLVSEIGEIRERLTAVGEKRGGIAGDDHSGRTTLMDEEHRLQARLSEPKDLAAEAGAGPPPEG